MNRVPLLLLHGALGCREQMAPFVAPLSEFTTVHVMDFEGHGASPPSGRPFATEHFAENVLAHLDAEGLDQVDVFGYSMGGYVALYLAAIAPERLRFIGTFGTKLAWSPEFAAGEIARLDPEIVAAKVPQFAAVLAERHGEDRWRDLMRDTAAMMEALGRSPVLTQDVLASVSHPVTICRGIDDNMVTHDDVTFALDALPHAVGVTVFDTDHPIEKADVDVVLEPLLPFFFGDPDNPLGLEDDLEL